MTTDQLNCFTVLAKTLNFTVTAEKLFISQSTLTRTIKSLENELGVKLFYRNTKSVKLTLGAEKFLPIAEEMIKLYNESKILVNTERETKHGIIRISETNFPAINYLIELICHAKRLYPYVKIESTDNSKYRAMELLKKRKVDIVLTCDRNLDKRHQFQTLILQKSPLCIFVSPEHKFANESRKFCLEEFQQDTFLVMDDVAYSSFPLNQLNIPFDKRERAIKSPIRLLSMVEAGCGVALLHKDIGKMFVTSSVHLELKEKYEYTTVAVWEEDNPNPYLEVFIELLKDISLKND